MIVFSRSLLLALSIFALVGSCVGGNPISTDPAATASLTYVISNDDKAAPFDNIVSFYIPVGGSPASDLTVTASVGMPGQGLAGGYFATPRLSSAVSTSCLFVADAGTGDISAVEVQSKQATGPFFGSQTDSGNANGIGLALNSNYLYASFTSSNTIATFIVMPGCQLSFLSDVSANGLHGGNVNGMAIHGNLMVVAYGDGSIESFDISAAPVSNGDAQDATGFIAHFYTPTGVDITKDGRYAIFGDASEDATVEVSDISSGKLTRTVAYSVSQGVSASHVRLTRDENMLFISNSQGGTVTAAFFDKNTGRVSSGCVSPTLNGFYRKFYTHGFLETPWFFLGTVVPEGLSANGGVVYVAEFGATRSYIGIINVISDGKTCRMTESSASPAVDYNAGIGGLLTIIGYPPRSF